MSKLELFELAGYVSREELNGITQELLKHLFRYEDGKLFWLPNHKRYGIKNDEAGHVKLYRNGERRCNIGINRSFYKRNRLVFLYHNGYLTEAIDHINCDPTDDRIENLRAADFSKNMGNRKKGTAKEYHSIYKGVSFVKSANRFRACINYLGARKEPRYFKSEILAALHYNRIAVKYFGEFARLNIIEPGRLHRVI